MNAFEQCHKSTDFLNSDRECAMPAVSTINKKSAIFQHFCQNFEILVTLQIKNINITSKVFLCSAVSKAKCTKECN